MPLSNFGAVLNFAETIEREDMGFYRHAAKHPLAGAHQELFERLSAEGQKNVALVQRTRRENVTEMILEPIRGFFRDSYAVALTDGQHMDGPALLSTAAALENRAIRYYRDAAEKIRALPEVSRAMNTMGSPSLPPSSADSPGADEHGQPSG